MQPSKIWSLSRKLSSINLDEQFPKRLKLITLKGQKVTILSYLNETNISTKKKIKTLQKPRNPTKQRNKNHGPR